MTRVLVTGASGFIGNHLVRHLAKAGDEVCCLVRATSRCQAIQPYVSRFVVGDLHDEAVLRRAVEDVDVIYHLAGRTTAFHESDFQRDNVEGVHRLASVAAQSRRSPRFIYVSSLAAAGPNVDGRSRREDDPVAPVSQYGRSKLEGERALRAFAEHLPISIVRPPIVIGEGDANGFLLFQSIARQGIHVVPGEGQEPYSVIAAKDLVEALRLVWNSGRWLQKADEDSQGIYFVSDPQRPGYADLGRMIATAVHQRSLRVLRVPKPLVWAVAAGYECAGRLRGKPMIMNFDKAREAVAGGWSCESTVLQQDTGFVPAASLQQRLNETAAWYLQHQWLPPIQQSGRKPMVRPSHSTHAGSMNAS